jgi:hypothetical protein
MQPGDHALYLKQVLKRRRARAKRAAEAAE